MTKYLIILFSFSFAVVTVSQDGTQDFTTIQEAIDHVTTNPTDTEIDVYPGTYQENLLIEADMIIRSVGDANNTIIDGSLGRSLGSTIVIRPETMSTHHPLVEIDGFSIKNGKGTDVVNNTITLPDGTHPTEKVGGGLFVYVNSPKINNSQFLDNGNNSTDKGGAVFAASDSDDIGILERDHYEVHPDLPPAVGPLDFSNNTFLGNDADQGHSVYIDGYESTTTSMAGDSLDVFSSTYNSATEYWVKSESEINFSGAYSDVEAIYDSVWVDPVNGVDEGNITGYEDNPFLTINYAMGMIYPTEENPITINLTAGTFSPPIEVFPINMISNVNLIGEGVELTILNAEGSIENPRTVITMEGVDEVAIESLTISGGFSMGNGGGMKIAYSDPIISNVSIKDNYAQWHGGGISLELSNPSMTNVTIKDNYAQDDGGGIFLGLSNPSMTNVTIKDNYAQDDGGGIHGYDSNIILNNVTITGNTAERDGGGLKLRDIDSILNNVTITGNTAGNLGGGIYLGGFDNFSSLQNVIIQGNSAPAGGGAYLEGSPILTDVSITENISISGGGIFAQDPNFTIRNSIVSNNVSTGSGGGLFLAEDGNPYIEDTFISDNTASSGAGLYIETNVYVNIEGGVISSNFAQYNGGGIAVRYSSVLNLDGTVIENNVSGQDGGGIYFFYSDSSQISDVTLINNSAGDEGGGIYYYQSNGPSIANSTIQGNSAATFGGGLYGFYSHNASFEDITLSENTAYSGAGAYMYYSNNPVFTRGLISNNIATNEGGGLSFFYSANPIFSYSEISGNSAYTGGGINLYNTNPLLNNMTFSGNNATYGGGGIYGYESDVDMVNSILWYNSPDEIYSVGYSELNIFFSDIENGWNGEGNIDADPLFINSETGDYTLQTDSPCIDAGITDLDGDGIDDITDYFGQAPDMGAYEYMGDILPGDINDDGLINILDVVALVNIVLTGGDYNTAGDLNSDEVNNVLDVVFLVNIILNG